MGIELGGQQALRIWSRALSASVLDDGPDLTSRQMAILLTVYLQPSPHTVRGLSGNLGITKPVVTRALDTLSKHGLLKRRTDETDRRSVLVERTMEGAKFLARFSDHIIQAGQKE